MWGNFRTVASRAHAHRMLVWLVGVCLTLGAAPAAGAQSSHHISVKVILAQPKGQVDPKLKELAKQLRALKFDSYQLKDEAKFSLELGSSGRMQLPGGEWMTIQALELVDDPKDGTGLLRTIIEVEKLEFKATVQIGAGATVVVRGPGFGKGTLILAVTRLTEP